MKSFEKKPQDFLSFSQTFSRSGKLLGKFQDFFKNSRLCTNPDNYYRTPHKENYYDLTDQNLICNFHNNLT